MVVKDPKNKKPILQLTYQSVEADPEEEADKSVPVSSFTIGIQPERKIAK